ncbi:Por secretion system C-terminal sorting domain-containing protein [Chitinophaga costaii]|uniref:Por secretion system C-terminal sorting domain-containing protein n=1 Tax=Chitinophaga costaii TaxID=1335309 RepID=A0A1C4BC28_9BACT|nr:T9SS type A sorting domain-containing protein [Chitinophaga costaii]PUZ27668.1 T9SS C-terminal target domain-containing protein [Chitinophaga costaii]SCC04407.1 Por secretion system C-terminal sorting domain-containing protein [Chitinophaga costaii]
MVYTDLVTGDQLSGLNSLFNANIGSNYNFYLGGVAKYPDLSYTVYGLINHGNKTAAASIIDATIRGTVLSGMFSEYATNTGTVYPQGVRPSTFSACALIDFVWLKNGFDYDKGFPHVVNVFNGARGVSNIRFDEQNLNITANNGHYSFTGSFLNQPTTLTLDTTLVAPVPLGAPEQVATHPGSGDLCISWWKFYPNPLRDYLNVTFYLSRPERVLLRIFDQAGRPRAARYERLSQGTHQMVFDTHRYAAGVYYCNLTTSGEKKCGKFIKIP